ncbi:MAG: YggS family pyridoxal phosphate-dependent enzyme [Anaerolineae bacterium]|nr:YggS family pyridoxal phosphate-dependent enzyme [Anaerolineae bacterium]
MTDISANLARIRERVAEAAQRVGRAPEDVTLVAVTKTHPADVVLAAYEAGVRHFGENRAREGISKITAIEPYISGEIPNWHMIGHIQSRKARRVVEHYDYVHSVDRVSIAQRLSSYIDGGEKVLPVLLECNISGEGSKYGFALRDWEENEARQKAFFGAVDEILALPGLEVRGLMTMPPYVDDPEEVRPLFASLRSLRDVLRERFTSVDWRHLSMGMTNDFEVAIEEGATMVRVGRGIFGPRGS